MKYVCFIGDDRVGKSTLCRAFEHVISQYDQKAATLSFSDALRQELVQLYGIPSSIIFDKHIDKESTMIHFSQYAIDPSIVNIWKQFGLSTDEQDFFSKIISLRELFGIHGTKIRRRQDPYYWSKYLERQIQLSFHDIDILVNDDTREPEDFAFFDDKEVCFIHVTNGMKTSSNAAQTAVREWIYNNPTKIFLTLNVPVPLTDQIAQLYVLYHILPYLPKQVEDIYHAF